MLSDKIATLIELVLECDYKHIKEKVWISPKLQFRDKCWFQIQLWAGIMIFHCLSTLSWHFINSSDIFLATFPVCQMLVWESNSHFGFWHFQRICGKVHWTIFKLLSKRFPRMDPPEVEQNVSCKEKKRVTVKNTF